MLSLESLDKRKFAVAIGIGLLSEVIPIPGMLGAALIFPQGIHSDYAVTYLITALFINLISITAASYLTIGAILKWRAGKRSD